MANSWTDHGQFSRPGHVLQVCDLGKHGADDGIRTRDPHLGKKKKVIGVVQTRPPDSVRCGSVQEFVQSAV